jgi:hypothetical protein
MKGIVAVVLLLGNERAIEIASTRVMREKRGAGVPWFLAARCVKISAGKVVLRKEHGKKNA